MGQDRSKRARIPIALAAAVVALFGTAAHANCPQNRLNGLTATLSGSPVVGSYDPFAGADAVVDMSVALTNPANQVCDAAISFARAPTAAVMSNGAATLSYALEPAGGGGSLITTGYVQSSTPGAANRVNVTVPAEGSASAAFRLRIPASQVVAAGSYQDIQIQLILVGIGNNGPESSRSGPSFVPQATVIQKCILPSPSLPSVNLSSAIANGRPNEGVSQSVSFSNVQCTAPTKLRLTGAALQPTISTPARPGFDNFINFRAAGTFGAASSVLTTATTANSVDSVQKNAASGATTNGQIAVDINLVNGQPIIAGAYSGTLTVSIDPSF